MNLFNKLNQQQLNAVKYTDGPLLVLAGAGSGKTRVITHKIVHLISNCKILAKNITAITFTNKAAKEMLERASKLTNGVDTRGLTITTFHSLGLKILKEEANHLGYKTNFSILDGYDSAKVMGDIVKSTDKQVVRSIQNQISLWKNAFVTPDKAVAIANSDLELATAKFYQIYSDTLKTYQAMDFDDLIKLPVDLFNCNLEVLYKWQQKIRYLLIDEYQDTNVCQYALIKLIAGSSGMFTAVGDDDQSIYAWRGANAENLKILGKDYPRLQLIKLEQNYRSTSTILTAANSVIKHNPKIFEKKLWSEFGSGESIRIIACKNDEVEADTVARKVMLHQLHNQTKFSDYAILYRSNWQARVLEQSLRNYKIPYSIAGGQSFFDKTEIKDICAYLRLLINEDDDTAFIRAITTPKRGIGQVTLEKLANYASTRQVSLFEGLFEEGFAIQCHNNQLNDVLHFGQFINNLQSRINKDTPKDLLLDLVASIGYEAYLYEQDDIKVAEKKWGNVLSFIDWLGKKGDEDNKTLADLVQMINLIGMLDSNDENSIDAIKLSTLHAAKGLEYPYVFLISCEDGILPHQESINANQIEEERRLMYVGITRAQLELTISHCQERRKAGNIEPQIRSRFLDEIGDDNIIDESKKRLEKITDNQELKSRLEKLRELLHN